MVKTLINTAIVGILGSRWILPAVLTGMVKTAAAMLTARILLTAALGLSPLAASARSRRISVPLSA